LKNLWTAYQISTGRSVTSTCRRLECCTGTTSLVLVEERRSIEVGGVVGVGVRVVVD
jgi:hypothetical protein